MRIEKEKTMICRFGTLLAAGIVLSAALFGNAGSAHAGHPLGTEDAETRGKGNVEVEFNWERAHGSDGNREIRLGNIYTLGVASRVDLAVSFAYGILKTDAIAETVRGMGDTEVTLKTSFLDGNGWMPTVGLKAGALLPTGDPAKRLGDGRASGLFTLIADWERGPLLTHLNIGYTLAGRPVGSIDRDDRFRSSLAAEWEVRHHWTVVGEYLREKNLGASGLAASEVTFGGKWEVVHGFTLDTGIRWGTTVASPNVTYLAGATLEFDGGKEAGEHRK